MLPQELIRNIFELAAESDMPERLEAPVSLSLVCSASRVWMRTILYRTIHISLLHEWEAFRRTVLQQPGALPVISLSLLVRPPPEEDDVAAVLNALPQLIRVQVALSLVPQLAVSSVQRLVVSKHGPTANELPASLRLTRITHLYFEPFYSALYPPAIRMALPTVFPALTHFGVAYVPSSSAVARDLLDLASPKTQEG
ncbi:hypothetical protein AURDEDRAFT_125967 [Auricularia subglabra TFB-10046 SS5]|nr:hypothetical protein AURDEDRAFT_125967 [Auricularia subglabra TFB-10046 SS5]